MVLNIHEDEKLDMPAFLLQPRRLESHLTVHDIPMDERPRERLRNHGPQALSSAELLAIILRTGTARENVLELAGKLLARYSGLGGLLNLDFDELCRVHGLGEAKCCQIKAALELGKRLGQQQFETKYQIKSSHDAANLVMVEMTYLDHEEMRVLALDTKNQVAENISLYRGTVNSSVLRIAELFRPAITRNCPAILVCHNHPSGDPTPSAEDIEVTEQLVKAGKVLEIEVIDHLVIGNHKYTSLREHLRWS
ncbi:MAG TPA: DNA repair protein RadC [Ktedonobacteraceae bacterium]